MVLIRIEKRRISQRIGVAYPSMAWSRWNESGVRRINASQAVTSQLDTFFCSLLLLPDLSHNSWLAASRSGAGGIGLAITTTSYDYTIRCTCEPTVGKGWEEWMEKKKKREKGKLRLSRQWKTIRQRSERLGRSQIKSKCRSGRVDR